ncbi:MAG: PH domain-containing protein [Candidatus Micrarchaeaceae archaeon]
MKDKLSDLDILLLPEEHMVYSAAVPSSITKSKTIALTNRRFIMLDGYSDYTSVFYSDIVDISAEKRLLRLDVIIKVSNSAEPIVFRLKNSDVAEEICEKINKCVYEAKLGIESMVNTDREVYMAVQTQEAASSVRGIGIEQAKRLARLNETIVIEEGGNALAKNEEAKSASIQKKASAVQLEKKVSIVGNRVRILAGDYSNKTISMVITGIRKGAPIFASFASAIKTSRKGISSLLPAFGKESSSVLSGISGYAAVSKQKTFVYDFKTGRLIGSNALGYSRDADATAKKTSLDLNSFMIFSHRRVKEGMGAGS